MSRLIDLTGQRFGKLVVLERADSVRKPCGTLETMWLCKCDCGTIKPIRASSLRSGNSTTCGCGTIEAIKKKWTKHGETRTRLHSKWSNMLQRCYDKHSKEYKRYGAKGITVCDEWKDYMAFREWAYANGYSDDAKKEDVTIDRIDSTKGYSPENCRFANYYVQNNNKSNTVMLTAFGETKPVSVFAREYGLKPETVKCRVQRLKWDAETALTKEVRKNGRWD